MILAHSTIYSRTISEAKPSAVMGQFAVIPQLLFCDRFWPALADDDARLHAKKRSFADVSVEKLRGHRHRPDLADTVSSSCSIADVYFGCKPKVQICLGLSEACPPWFVVPRLSSNDEQASDNP